MRKRWAVLGFAAMALAASCYAFIWPGNGEWVLVPAWPVVAADPTSTVIGIGADHSGCGPDLRFELDEQPDKIVLRAFEYRGGGAQCMAIVPQSETFELRQPVGERRIVDDSGAPAYPTGQCLTNRCRSWQQALETTDN